MLNTSFESYAELVQMFDLKFADDLYHHCRERSVLTSRSIREELNILVDGLKGGVIWMEDFNS